MNGLEIMRGIVTGDIPHPSIAKTIPMQVLEAQEGTVRFEVIADSRHTNPFGGIHGGFAATVLDSVTGCAVHTMLAAGQSYGTIALNVKMLKPIPKNKTLTAEGTIISMSKSLGVSRGEITDSDSNILAYATATCMIVRPNQC